ncbi:MAG: hypothetical protein JHD28_06470 [Bacteroidia bacterium]|nr:hypothetical protein [Bacteroidia bacterium]
MKSFIVTLVENANLDQLLHTIESLNSVKKAENEKILSIPGNVLDEQDYIYIVAEAETDEYVSVNEVFSNLKRDISFQY